MRRGCWGLGKTYRADLKWVWLICFTNPLRPASKRAHRQTGALFVLPQIAAMVTDLFLTTETQGKKGPKCDLPPAPGPVELQYTSRNICRSTVTAVLDICIVSSCSEQPWRTENQIVQESNRSVWVFVIE